MTKEPQNILDFAPLEMMSIYQLSDKDFISANMGKIFAEVKSLLDDKYHS